MSLQAAIDGNQFLQDLSKRLSVPMAFDAIMRVRCSPGVCDSVEHMSGVICNGQLC